MNKTTFTNHNCDLICKFTFSFRHLFSYLFVGIYVLILFSVLWILFSIGQWQIFTLTCSEKYRDMKKIWKKPEYVCVGICLWQFGFGKLFHVIQTNLEYHWDKATVISFGAFPHKSFHIKKRKILYKYILLRIMKLRHFLSNKKFPNNLNLVSCRTPLKSKAKKRKKWRRKLHTKAEIALMLDIKANLFHKQHI